MPDAEQSIQTLRDEIRHHDELYYAQAAPEIPDRQYDRLMQQLQQLEAENPELITPDSPTHRVGGTPTKGFRKVRHREPMLSIDNTYCREDIVRFDKRVRDALGDGEYSYGVEPKIDGVAVALRYHGRMLVEALTRGDGATGDDITGNARTIRSIPLNLGRADMPDELEIRGEIHWARSAFNRYNAQRVAEGQEPLANSRNGTAGTIKQQNPHIVAQRQLSFTAHGFGHMTHPLGSTGEEVTERLRVCGVPVSSHRWVCHSVDEIWEAIEAWDALRSDADYDTDGLVIKVNELAHRQTLGATPRHPR
jgi:DNA ligase (NAD+)